MYQSLGLMSVTISTFYACGPAQGLWGRALMENVGCMDHQHLRMLLRHLMLSFTKSCPAQHRQVHCSPVVFLITSYPLATTLSTLTPPITPPAPRPPPFWPLAQPGPFSLEVLLFMYLQSLFLRCASHVVCAACHVSVVYMFWLLLCVRTGQECSLQACPDA